jgi:translocation protein SEC66
MHEKTKQMQKELALRREEEARKQAVRDQRKEKKEKKEKKEETDALAATKESTPAAAAAEVEATA